jgi:hypothetical protein
MRTVPVHMRDVALALALLAAPAVTYAQPVATQNGNVWDWRAHQPTEGRVQQKEHAAGVAPTPSQRDQAATTVDDLYRQLEGKNG